VKNLSYSTSENSLKSYFEKFGNVGRVNILKKDDGRSKGIGFVAFDNADEAQSALKDETHTIDGRAVTVSKANERKEGGRDSGRDSARRGDRRDDRRDNDRRRDSRNDDSSRDRSRGRGGDNDGPKHTIFVGNLGFRTTERDIRNFFRDCGKVADIRVAKNDEGRSKGFCHVDFEDADSIEKALKRSGEELDGRQLKVDESRPMSRSGGSSGGFRGGRDGGRGRGRGGRGGGGGYNRRRDEDDD